LAQFEKMQYSDKETGSMQATEVIRCRVAACREVLDDGNLWSFYLINDSAASLDSATLFQVGYEWGDMWNSETTDVSVTDLAPGAPALIWRDDGSGTEFRMDLSFLVRVYGREALLWFEFPKLYRKLNLPLIEDLGRPGWQETAEAR
jgi:hypothetical protein